MDDPATNWRDGFTTLELIIENLLGLLIGGFGLFFLAMDLFVVAKGIGSLFRRFDWVIFAFGLSGVCLLSLSAGFLLFLASQFIGLRARR
jgi:hypothetical protein